MELLAYFMVSPLGLLLLTPEMTSPVSSRSTSSMTSSSTVVGNNGLKVASTATKGNKTDVNLLVLLPRRQDSIFSIGKSRPAISLAVESDKVAEILPGHNLVIRYEDTKCHISYAMNKAIVHYINGTADAFIGPVCDYAIAPVARQAKYWHVPVISSGAMAQDFLKRRYMLYNTLTRTGPNHNTLIAFVATMFRHYNYTHTFILYEPKGQNYIMDKLCYVTASSMHEMLKSPTYNISNDYSKMEDHRQIEDILRLKVGVGFGSEYITRAFRYHHLASCLKP